MSESIITTILLVIASILLAVMLVAKLEKLFEKKIREKIEKEIPRKDTFSQWLEDRWEDGDMCPPPLEDKDALDFLRLYLLGKDWYVTMPISHNQCNTEIVDAILQKYSKDYKRELKESRN